MAGDWIKIEMATPDKPEVVAIAAALRLDQDAVTGKLVRIWVWADINSIDGADMSISDAFIDRLTNKRGFAAAMRRAGWLQGSDGMLSFPDFERHNGKSAKLRAETNRRVADHRERNKNVTAEALQKPLPEKRREDKDTPKPPEGGALAVLDLIRRIKSLRSTWNASPLLSSKEHRAFSRNEALLAGFSAEDWSVLAEFYQFKPAEGSAFYQPRILAKFLADAGEVLGHARGWKSKQRPRLAVVPSPVAPVIIPREQLAEVFNQKSS